MAVALIDDSLRSKANPSSVSSLYLSLAILFSTRCRVLNLLYNFLDTCYADIQSEVQIIDEFFGFFAFLGRSASSDEGEERRYMRIQEFITELCEFLAKKSSGAAAHRTVDMAENLEERYNIIGKDDSKKRNTPRRSIFQLGLPLRDMPSATAHGNGIDTSPTSSPRILAIPTSSSPSLLSLESIPKAYPLSKGIRDPRRVRLEQIHPVEVARQLTLIEFQMFCKISSEELLGLGWMKESKEWSAPNITELISHSNLMSDWVTTTIVSTEPLKLRQKVLRHFILIAQSCFEINNFNTLFEICHALASQPVFRLSKTWEGIPKADMHKYRHLEEVTAFKSNRRNYRQELKRVQDKHRRPSTGNARYHTDSCLPYLGVHLTDLGSSLQVTCVLIGVNALTTIVDSVFRRGQSQREDCPDRAREQPSLHQFHQALPHESSRA